LKKDKTKFVCASCGYESIRWLGKCPECESWNSFSEELVVKEDAKGKRTFSGSLNMSKLEKIESSSIARFSSGIGELDRTLGGGFVPGSVILLGGEPGIGKSTILLQSLALLAKPSLYVTGEESLQQIKMRAERLGIRSDLITILAETDVNKILSAINDTSPSLFVIDSIQTVHNPELMSSPGTVSQIRESAYALMENAKTTGRTAVIIGHVTKEGSLAGPKILEHMVDTVLQFEGDSNNLFRIIRAIKNRFGSSNEIGVFEMQGSGLMEVLNPSGVFLNEDKTVNSGSCITAVFEGTRAILTEVQALVVPSYFGNPSRITSGFDQRKLSILLAVLEKRAKINLSNKNVFINVSGGMRIDEPASDLPICLSVISSAQEKTLPAGMIVIGEVGLGGEIRGVSQIIARLKEAEKLGFTSAIIPKANLPETKGKTGMKIKAVATIEEAVG